MLDECCTSWQRTAAKMGAGLEMLTQYNEEGESFLSWIVTGDETYCKIGYQNARAHPWCGKWPTKQHCKSLKKKHVRVKFQQPFSGTIMVFSYSNITRKVLLWLLRRISTHWFTSKRSLRVNARVCWSEK